MKEVTSISSLLLLKDKRVRVTKPHFFHSFEGILKDVNLSYTDGLYYLIIAKPNSMSVVPFDTKVDVLTKIIEENEGT